MKMLHEEIDERSLELTLSAPASSHQMISLWENRTGVRLSIVLVVYFQMPAFPKIGEFSLNGLYHAACVLFLFPLIILCGAHSDAGTGMIRLCKFSGHLSYPLYITHIPFVYILAGYSWTRRPSLDMKLALIVLFIPFVMFVAWLILKYYDEPVRAWLTRHCGTKRTTPALSEQLGEAQ